MEEQAATKPELRGVLHLVAFFVTLAASVPLVASSERELRLESAIYTASLAGLFGTSAAYHCPNWRPRARRWMRRLDHSMIYLLIAGTYTPALASIGSRDFLVVIWIVAAVGIAATLAPVSLPKPVTVLPYVAMGWFGVGALPSIARNHGSLFLALILVGGVLYTIGAAAYARRSPNPIPGVFGYHEVFHALVTAAATCHFAAVAMTVS